MTELSQQPESDEPVNAVQIGGLTSKRLARAIFRADFPEHLVASLPVQSLYMAIQHNGLEASVDLIEMTPLKKCRLLLDFDCWQKDTFDEERFWNWLQLTNDDDPLSILQRLLKCMDLKIIALLIKLYVEVHVQEEPTELPPAPGFYTPDKGYTWLYLKLEDEERHLALGRLLAMVFETDAELFYQLIAIAGSSTRIELEETAFDEKSKRLANEGIPDTEFAAQLNAPLPANHTLASIRGAKEGSGLGKAIEPVQAVTPLVYDSEILQPLADLLQSVEPREIIEGELSLLMNAALVHWGVSPANAEAVLTITDQVKGSINIGIETVLERQSFTMRELYEEIGISALYRIGLDELFAVRRTARNILGKDKITDATEPTVLVAQALALPFPMLPQFFQSGSVVPDENGKLPTNLYAIQHRRDLLSASEFLTR